MPACQTAWPRQWLMTDERLGDALWRVLARLPAGAGVVFRHHHLPAQARYELAQRVAAACEARGLVLAIAQDVPLAQTVGAALVHNPALPTDFPFSASVHSMSEAVAARLAGAALVFVSPVYPTRSHPGAPTLGPAAAARIAAEAGDLAIALGGMDEQRFAALPEGVFHGWAAIDAWLNRAD